MSLWDDSLDLAIRSGDAIQEFAYVNSDLVYATGVIVVGVGVMMWVASRQSKDKDPGEGKKMNKGEYILSRRELRQQEQNAIADALADGLLTALAKGTISDEVYRKVHLRLGGAFGFKDLLPLKNLTPEQLKEAIKKRRGHKVYRVVPFPKETPTTPTTLKGILSKFKS